MAERRGLYSTAYRKNDRIIHGQLLTCVNEALDKLYENDGHLIKYYVERDKDCQKNLYHVGERSIVFRFGLYFYEAIQQYPDLKALDLDCEYNRNGEQPKKLPSFEKGTYPDIILHQRASNEHNTLVMEFKGYWNYKTKDDFQKLSDFTKQYSVYNFLLGLFVKLGKSRERVEITQFVDGQEISEDENLGRELI